MGIEDNFPTGVPDPHSKDEVGLGEEYELRLGNDLAVHGDQWIVGDRHDGVSDLVEPPIELRDGSDFQPWPLGESPHGYVVRFGKPRDGQEDRHEKRQQLGENGNDQDESHDLEPECHEPSKQREDRADPNNRHDEDADQAPWVGIPGGRVLDGRGHSIPVTKAALRGFNLALDNPSSPKYQSVRNGSDGDQQLRCPLDNRVTSEQPEAPLENWSPTRSECKQSHGGGPDYRRTPWARCLTLRLRTAHATILVWVPRRSWNRCPDDVWTLCWVVGIAATAGHCYWGTSGAVLVWAVYLADVRLQIQKRGGTSDLFANGSSG